MDIREQESPGDLDLAVPLTCLIWWPLPDSSKEGVKAEGLSI